MAGHRARMPMLSLDTLRSRPVQIGAASALALAVVAVICWALLHQPGTTPAAGHFAPPVSTTDAATPLPSVTDPVPPPPTAPPSVPPTPSPAAATPTATPKPATPTAKPPADPGQTRKFFITLYGARDNDPPGSRAIAYPTIHRQAGGTGTFADPITFATSKAVLPIGTKIYYPTLKRYFVMEDQCVSCEDEFKSSKKQHIDLWAGESTNAGIIKCEEALTPGGQVPVVVNPPADLPVVTSPIYDGSKCYKP